MNSNKTQKKEKLHKKILLIQVFTPNICIYCAQDVVAGDIANYPKFQRCLSDPEVKRQNKRTIKSNEPFQIVFVILRYFCGQKRLVYLVHIL